MGTMKLKGVKRMTDSLWLELDFFKWFLEDLREDLKVSLTWSSMNGWRKADNLILTIDSISKG